MRDTENTRPSDMRNPNVDRPLDEQDYDNPYIKKEGETHKERMKRLNLTKKLLKKNIDDQIGVKDNKILTSFNKGKGGNR